MRPRLFPRRFLGLLGLLALSLTVAGCAGAGGPSAGSPERAARRSSTRITSDELAVVAEIDVYTAIGRLRSPWLRPQSRGMVPQVILNGAPQSGGVESLRSLRAADVSELEFMSASDATTRYGTGYPAGAILVTLRRR